MSRRIRIAITAALGAAKAYGFGLQRSQRPALPRAAVNDGSR